VGRATVLGGLTHVAEGALVDSSVVGRRCRIGKNAKVTNSYLWDDVVIEEGAIVDASIVANGAIIKAGACLESGCIVSFGVVVGEGRRVPGNVRLTCNGGSDYEDNSEVVGTDGAGHVFHESDISDAEGSDDDEGDQFGAGGDSLIYSMQDLHLSDTSIESVRQSKRATHHTRTLSSASAGTASSDDGEEESFYREAVASIERSIREHHAQDIALLELNTLRMTMNVGHDEVRSATLHALISHVSKLVSTGTEDVKPATTNTFNEWSHVIRRITFDADDQVELLLKLQKECARLAPGQKILFYAADTLYENDVVAEENIYRWWNLPDSVATDQMLDVRTLTAKWVEWLQTAEEESDEE
jgi:translation initiation factor eIF-2B subunit epsilon